MSKQKLNLSAVPGIQEVDDRAAENLTGGAFDVILDPNGLPIAYDGAQGWIDLAGATQLGILNDDANAGNPNADGNNFEVEYYNQNTQQGLGRETARFGAGVTRFNEMVQAGATHALITQYCDCPTP